MAATMAAAAPLSERQIIGEGAKPAPFLSNRSADFSTSPHQGGQMNGVTMQRIIGVALATFAFSSLRGVLAVANASGAMGGFDEGAQRATIDVAALLTAARGAPPMICSLAANSVGNGWGGWSDAPYTPLAASATPLNYRDRDWRNFSSEDVQRLFAGLSSDDACVRELSVRLIGTQKAEAVGNELVTRLTGSDASLRAAA